EVRKPAKKVAILSITSNRGLCGAFNTNIIKRTENIMEREKSEGRDVELLLVGKKGMSYFKFVGAEILKSFPDITDTPTFDNAKEIANLIIKLYEEKKVDTVFLVFNHFKSLMEQRPIEYRVLPIKEEGVTREEEGEEKKLFEYIFEPSAEKILFHLLPTYIETLVFRALLESVASEHAARRAAMKAATDNAKEMINLLTLTYNKARQSQITQEITEIVTSAEAIRSNN
ncbi:MAG: ATP synthase F1 subunit gamma, partial [Actinomycetia bacterium]|nr:ATP synthase F1 subunit gamma [Actinomycetes bacterium]